MQNLVLTNLDNDVYSTNSCLCFELSHPMSRAAIVLYRRSCTLVLYIVTQMLLCSKPTIVLACNNAIMVMFFGLGYSSNEVCCGYIYVEDGDDKIPQMNT